MTSLGVEGYRVPKGGVFLPDDAAVRQVCKALSLKPFSPVDNGWVRPVGFFQETKEALFVPRQYGCATWGPPSKGWADAHLVQRMGEFPFVGGLRVLPDGTSQQQACDATLSELRSRGGCILSLYTGAGKTTCALWVARALGVKTAVVVHKEPLMAQWKERIEQFLPGARVGVVRGEHAVVLDESDVTICMIQSLLSVTRSHEGLEKVGLVILDEVHHVAARMFSRVFHKMTRPYMLGLSATVDRKDRLHTAFDWLLGGVSYRAELKAAGGVSVRVVSHRTAVQVALNKRDQVNFTQMVSDLTEEPSRNALLMRTLLEICDGRRSVLVLSDRRAHCKALHDAWNQQKPADEAETGVLLLGGAATLPEERRRLYFGTYSLMSEGVDIPHLDTLLMATPRADVKQSVGRVLRGNNRDSLVVDLVDSLGPLYAQARKRRNFYRLSGFHVTSGSESNDRADVAFVG